jgi:hypothetical protein
MVAAIFWAIGAVFIWLLFKGYSTREIMARGWGTQVRIYQRDGEPIMYWFTFWLYLFIAALCTTIGILTTFKIITHHAA